MPNPTPAIPSRFAPVIGVAQTDGERPKQMPKYWTPLDLAACSALIFGDMVTVLQRDTGDLFEGHVIRIWKGHLDVMFGHRHVETFLVECDGMEPHCGCAMSPDDDFMLVARCAEPRVSGERTGAVAGASDTDVNLPTLLAASGPFMRLVARIQRCEADTATLNNKLLESEGTIIALRDEVAALRRFITSMRKVS